ncbi:hypothetical protein DFH11DRAFT_254702 [Phellopilus nigrolimitatus]|nr:hypothetical protein DFH11DRAFT_254702 [Phellopilus nigrolimitatus]
MTTWKSRLAVSRNANAESEVDEALLNTGLFTYPVLQAADILAYRSTHVPVGADQQQHLELCRDLAALFNRTVRAPLFPLPEAVFTPSRRVLSLTDPAAKMSKSAPDAGSRILLTDTAAAVRAKLRRAVTDAEHTIEYDPARRPGTANLLALLAGCTGSDARALAARYRDTGHAALKDAVADAVEETLRGPRAEFLRLRAEPAHLDALARSGAERAREMSRGTLARVRRLVGLS